LLKGGAAAYLPNSALLVLSKLIRDGLPCLTGIIINLVRQELFDFIAIALLKRTGLPLYWTKPRFIYRLEPPLDFFSQVTKLMRREGIFFNLDNAAYHKLKNSSKEGGRSTD
jgi:hypothetical protein